MTDPAAQVARLVAASGWPVLPMRLDTDEKAPAWRWSDGSGLLWNPAQCDPAWPRWATVCGQPRLRDGRSLVCLDADSREEVERARRWLPRATRVRTGKGEHTWLTLPPGADARLRTRFVINAGGLDWRGGACIVLLPGSLYLPVTDDRLRYQHVGGPPVHEAAAAPAALLAAVLSRAPGARAPAEHHGHGHAGPGYAEFLRRWREVVGADRVRTNRAGDASGPCPTDRHPEPIEERGRTALHASDDGNGGVLLHCHSRGCEFAEILRAVEPRWVAVL